MTPPPHRLLVIDDNLDYRALLRFALAGSTIEIVAESATPAEGIEVAGEIAPDVVLLDIVHHGDQGLAALRPLREAAPEATIVAVASYAEHELWGRASPLDGIAYLSKSTPATKLGAELERILASRHATDDVLDSAREHFTADLKSVRAARRFVADVLGRWECEELHDGAALLVSELATNAIIHAHSAVELALHLRPTRVRVEVIDTAREHVRRRDAKNDEQSGRGMALIDAVAVAWGIDSLLSGKSVWFEMERPRATT